MIFVPPGTAHGYRALRDVVVYNCFFRAELAENELLWASRDDALRTLFGRGVAGSGRSGDHVVAELDSAAFDDCIAELDAIRQQEPGERSHANELGHLLLALDVVARHGRRQVPTPPERCPATSRGVSMALDLIDQDLARRWTLADLSHEVFVGSFHLAHEFKRGSARRWAGRSLPRSLGISARRSAPAPANTAGAGTNGKGRKPNVAIVNVPTGGGWSPSNVPNGRIRLDSLLTPEPNSAS